MTPRRAVIFDFDGVIADSERLHLRAFQQVFAPRGWVIANDEYYERYLGFSDRELVESFARDQGLPLAPADLGTLVEDKGRVFAGLSASGGALFPGAQECVCRLAAHFPLAIASGALREEITHVLDLAGLRSSFLAIVGADDLRESKPAPAPYLEAARRLGAAPNACVAIEDSPWGLESATRAGLRTIGITHTYPAARLSGAHAIVSSLDEVTETFISELLDRVR